MSLISINTNKYNDGLFMNLRFDDNQNDHPKVVTGIITITDDIFFTKEVTLVLTKNQCPDLYKKIVQQETLLSGLLKSLPEKTIQDLPDHCQAVLHNHANELAKNPGHFIRPNYYGNTNPKIFLKSIKNVKITNWKLNKSFTPSDLGMGDYQLVVCIGSAYFGQHKNPLHISNLQVRIMEIKYKPLSSAISKPIKIPKRKKQDAIFPEPKRKHKIEEESQLFDFES